MVSLYDLFNHYYAHFLVKAIDCVQDLITLTALNADKT